MKGGLKTLGATLLSSLSLVSAFRDTSPYFVLSTANLPADIIQPLPIAYPNHVTAQIQELVSSCPSSVYIIIKAPTSTMADFVTSDSQSGYLSDYLQHTPSWLRSKVIFESVLAEKSELDLGGYIKSQCAIVDYEEVVWPSLLKQNLMTPRLITVQLPKIPPPEAPRARESKLRDMEVYLKHFLADPVLTRNMTVIYLSTPVDDPSEDTDEYYEIQQQEKDSKQKIYQMDEQYPESVHANHFKRDVDAYPRASRNGTGRGGVADHNLGVFEKYSFFSSGLFMGLTVSLFLLIVLYVALSAISGLQVSYMAFSKEMNPANQKKT